VLGIAAFSWVVARSAPGDPIDTQVLGGDRGA